MIRKCIYYPYRIQFGYRPEYHFMGGSSGNVYVRRHMDAKERGSNMLRDERPIDLKDRPRNIDTMLIVARNNHPQRGRDYHD